MADGRSKIQARELAGAYGFAVRGLEGATTLFPAPPTWPELRLEHRVREPGAAVTGDPTEGPFGSVHVPRDSRQATVHLGAWGRIVIDRSTMTATVEAPHVIEDAQLAERYLSPASAYLGSWLGRLTFHAGAFVANGRAWGVVGDQGTGKSTLLAELHRNGLPVLTEDLLVVERGVCFAGTRSIHLRAEAGHRFAALGESLSAARFGTRSRVALPYVEPEAPLAGWFYLRWGEAPRLTSVAVSERPRRLEANRTWKNLRDDPSALLELATLPAWDLERPAVWEQLPAVVDLVLGAVA